MKYTITEVDYDEKGVVFNLKDIVVTLEREDGLFEKITFLCTENGWELHLRAIYSHDENKVLQRFYGKYQTGITYTPVYEEQDPGLRRETYQLIEEIKNHPKVRLLFLF